jgi:hypothetical protein
MTPYGDDFGGPPALSRVVIDAVSDRLRVESTELPPLYEVIDLDALDSLFRDDEAVLGGAHVTFPYADFVVRIYADGRVELTDSMSGLSTDSADAPPADGTDDSIPSVEDTSVDDIGRDDPSVDDIGRDDPSEFEQNDDEFKSGTL